MKVPPQISTISALRGLGFRVEGLGVYVVGVRVEGLRVSGSAIGDLREWRIKCKGKGKIRGELRLSKLPEGLGVQGLEKKRESPLNPKP